MKGKRYTDDQIIAILKAHEVGTKVVGLVHKYGISEQSFYRWSEVRRHGG